MAAQGGNMRQQQQSNSNSKAGVHPASTAGSNAAVPSAELPYHRFKAGESILISNSKGQEVRSWCCKAYRLCSCIDLADPTSPHPFPRPTQDGPFQPPPPPYPPPTTPHYRPPACPFQRPILYPLMPASFQQLLSCSRSCSGKFMTSVNDVMFSDLLTVS